MKFNLFLALMLMASSSHAAYEDFDTDNSTLATAQYVGDLAEYGDIHIFGGRGEVLEFFDFLDDSEADFYSFDVEAGTSVHINTLTPFGPEEFDDPVLGLFNNLGDELASNDDSHIADSGADEEEFFGYDSFISYHFEDAGTYIIAISGYDDFDFSDADGATDFLYTVEITSVPVPAAVWLFGSALVGLVGLGRRKNV